MRRYLWPTVAGVLLVLVILALGIGSLQGSGNVLDPRAAQPSGGKALATLLRDRGVKVDLMQETSDVQDAAGPDVTILVTAPAELPELTIPSLIDSGARIVLIAPEQAVVDVVDLPIDVDREVKPETRQPACSDPIANRAGVTIAGGFTYSPREGVGCYASAGSATYVALESGRIAVLGSAAPLTNEYLDRQGDAALGLLLLGQTDRVLWVIPGAPPLGGGNASLTSLLPRALKLAVWALFIAVVVLAFVRGRRLGPVISEELPVVVRSAEVVEGTARLYRAAQARDTAAESLRNAVRQRLRRALSVPAEQRPEALVDAVAARSSRDPGEIASLLYGLVPADDTALVRLASELDSLDLEVRRP